MTTADVKKGISIGKIIRNAVVFNLKRSHEGVVNSDSLLHSVDRFFSLLDERGVDYLLVGGNREQVIGDA